VSPLAGRLSDRRGRLYPALIGLAAAGLLLPLFAAAANAWQLGLLVLVTAPLVGVLWAPSMALLADGAEAVGIAQGLAFALSNLGWSLGQTLGNAGMARLADATSDTVPYLTLSAIAFASLAVLARARRPASVLGAAEPGRAGR
jgi:MFS family permease